MSINVKIDRTLSIIDEINIYLETLKNVIDILDRNAIRQFIEILLEVYVREKNIYIFGNGGSASSASHFVCDVNKGVSFDLENKFKAISLNDNTAIMMAYANDLNYEDIFVEQLKNFLNEGDVVIGISGSGNSKNVLKAITYANYKGNITIGITGYDGGILKKIAHHSINAYIDDMQISEDIHMILIHLTTRLLQKVLADKVLTGVK